MAFTVVVSALLAAPVYYFAAITQLNPALVPQMTLTNGSRQIIFQGMQHVGTERFFKGVAFDLEAALSQGYILFYEGVRPSTPADDTWLDALVTNGQVGRMNRTIKEATVKRYHYDSHAQLTAHLHDFISACNYGRRLKTLKGLTPYEYIRKCWVQTPRGSSATRRCVPT